MKIIVIFVALHSLMHECSAHGRMQTPLSRGSLWRDPQERFNDTVINYNDIENNCGGLGNQFAVNGGLCGLCGDPWQQPQPRKHEFGGIYDSEIIPPENHFVKGQQFTISIMVKAAHGGYGVFQLCPFDSSTENTDVTEACFENNPIALHGDNVSPDNSRLLFHLTYTGPYYLAGTIPADFPEGTRALLRWKWKTGNSWGEDETGSGMGFGIQEHFFSCADLYIDTTLQPHIDCLTRSQVTGTFIDQPNSVCRNPNFCPSSPSCRHFVNNGFCSLGCLVQQQPLTCLSASGPYGDFCVAQCAADPNYCAALIAQRMCASVCLNT